MTAETQLCYRGARPPWLAARGGDLLERFGVQDSVRGSFRWVSPHRHSPPPNRPIPQLSERSDKLTDYEKGSPAWDIGQILTRHATFGQPCAKVLELRRTTLAHGNIPSEERVKRAWDTACTCGAGVSDSEITSRKNLKEEATVGQSRIPSAA